MTRLTDNPELARQTAAARPTAQYVCEAPACPRQGQPFPAIRRSGSRRPRTCSARCRVALYRAERRAELADR